MRIRSLKADSPAPDIGRRVQTLREEFDSSFQQPRVASVVDLEALLLIRVHEASLALRLSELGGLHECPVLTQVPSRYPAQLGLAGLQSRLVTAFSLSAFVARDEVSRSGRWLALWAQDRSVGFVFDEIDGYELVQKEQIRRRSHDNEHRHAAGAIVAGGALRPIVEMSAVVDTIRSSLSEANSKLE